MLQWNDKKLIAAKGAFSMDLEKLIKSECEKERKVSSPKWSKERSRMMISDIESRIRACLRKTKEKV